MANIGESIRNRRKFLKITQEELADIAGVGINTLIKMERGDGNPTLSVINKVLDVLGLEICTTVKTCESVVDKEKIDTAEKDTLEAIEEAKEQQKAYRNGTMTANPIDLSSVDNMLESMDVKS